MEKYDERTCACTLNRIFGFRPRTGRAIIGHFGSAAAVFADSRIREALPFTPGTDKINDREYEATEKELKRIASDGCRFICSCDADYPALLEECPEAPIGLYIKGRDDGTPIFTGRKFMAVVGTRDISLYGREWCEKIVSALSGTEDPPVIVSGLALGTDITAHRKALELGIPTMAVMATGIDAVYPHRHLGEGLRIAGTQGCALITDYPPGTAPVALNFLRRNRIIAGMCSATILVESKIKGGGMTTARLAFGYDRDVYALPGRADDIRSMGCNLLIKSKVAEPITGTEALVESLGMKSIPGRGSSGAASLYSGSMPADRIDIISRILLTVKNSRGIDIASIAEAMEMDYHTVSGYIGLLEADGILQVDMMQRCRILSPGTSYY